ncbi:dihydroneopterin aldolase [Thalassobacillus devorans]|uniref:7,8-dihydroneopterin aldolase n=1 Tax=Thalassobacillus devorans TaxID=279813 RepID=A0ABQ1PV69_9BACI|nr:dihydroneopterin aldolase [Thalassobacillus devorans]NIK30822.1 dihydroneopterin aldolase [Thalassobacillus devorans]GGD04524.1 dihydroneopterin aldolase [Thalassobacillus devorans]
MDKIYLNKMEFYGYHGLFPEENKLGQRFYVDLELDVDLEQAGKTDDMNASIDYGEIYQVTKGIVEGEAKKLVEAVAEDVADRLLGAFSKMEGCRVKVIKPDPPIPGHYQSVAIEIYRSRG